MQSGHKKYHNGFTIVELLIVIVIIGILAGLVITTFVGAQKKARDVKRTDDVSKIERGLEAYKVVNGQYPTATANPGSGGWELSTDVDGTFIESLKSGGFFGTVPVDPVNTTTYKYWYYRYPPGQYGCPVEQGGFYVLRAIYEDAKNVPKDGVAVSCPSGSQTGSGTLYLDSSFEN